MVEGRLKKQSVGKRQRQTTTRLIMGILERGPQGLSMCPGAELASIWTVRSCGHNLRLVQTSGLWENLTHSCILLKVEKKKTLYNLIDILTPLPPTMVVGSSVAEVERV